MIISVLQQRMHELILIWMEPKELGTKTNQDGKNILMVKGFYEGSLIFGNRFRNTNYETLKKIDQLSSKKLVQAPEFIRENLGLILQNNKNFYEKLFVLDENDNIDLNFSRDIFYYQKGNKK
jgi:hypothetical protein